MSTALVLVLVLLVAVAAVALAAPVVVVFRMKVWSIRCSRRVAKGTSISNWTFGALKTTPKRPRHHETSIHILGDAMESYTIRCFHRNYCVYCLADMILAECGVAA